MLNKTDELQRNTLNDVNEYPERAWLDLSLAQQSVWLDANVTGASAYQLGGWARVAAPLDESAVRQSVRLLMARHDALRLRVDDELPRQWLDASTEPPVTVFELSAESADAAFDSHLRQAFATPMPLGDHPLFRIDLLHAGPGLHFILWRFHHLIADSISVAITLSHWFEAYDALTSSTPGELSPASSYLPTIRADEAYLESAAYHQALAYWSARFDPLPPRLIADMELRAAATADVPSSHWTLSGQSFTRFQNAVAAAGTSVQRGLFALFALALGRRYGQTDVVSGVALHRRDPTNRNAIGMMAGVIAMRCDFDPFWTLQECMQAFSEQLDADLRHQRLPVDLLSRALGLSGTGRTGLFEVAMSYIPAQRGQAGSPIANVPVTTGMVETREASPISLHATELAEGAGLAVRIAVNPDFLEPGEAATLAALLQIAVDQFLSSPDCRFEDLPVTTETERALVVDQWNQTSAVFAVEKTATLDGLFCAQAAKTPEAVAVVGLDGRELSYIQLDDQSTHLARQLAAGGVVPGRVVGVRMARSTETIVALLAILKAGGAYLPLDPAYPAERLQYMAQDADAMLVLDSIDWLAELESTTPAELPELAVHEDAGRTAYVIYTSGTTGLPKGVAVDHAAAVNLAFARRTCHDPIGVGDRILAAISVGFDVSIGQLLLPLLAGATVVIAGEIKTMDAAEFWALLNDGRVTHINSVPSFFSSILDAAPAPGMLRLKRLMLGGEALSGALVKRIQLAIPGLEVVNMYGPTEACIDATYHVASAADYDAAVLPIGKPLTNYTTYVLNSDLTPVGIGVTGELFLGGSGLARGYVGAPALTAERFVTDPFSAQTDARLYRTGDRARWRADGEIEFLGRGDAQVKIRGFRVEPGEIAATLLEHPAVAQAIVVPRAIDAAKPGGSMRLIAYLVPRILVSRILVASDLVSHDDQIPESAELRTWLAERLPDYMIPAAFVAIDAMPLNRNGKLDVNALPAPELGSGEAVAPRTPTEEKVAALFAEVLGLEHCGAHDHFFELGGHSLLATKLTSRLRDQGWTVPLRSIFETPTVEMLARRIDSSLPALVADESYAPEPRPHDLPLSFPQERIWFVDRLQQDSSHNIPIAFRVHGNFDLKAAEQAMARILGRHEALRTLIVVRHEQPVQQILDDVTLPLELLDLSRLDEQAREGALRARLAELAAHRFDLARDLPLQLRLIKLAPDHHVVAAVVHHVAFDGWSAALFLREFAAIYGSLAQQSSDGLKPLLMQYADFALWQRRQDRAADLRFWLDELDDAPPSLDLPRSDFAPGTARVAGTLPVRIEPALHAQLLRLAQQKGASLFMLLHAAFALLLARSSGQDDVVLGTVSANRHRSEHEYLIGCFVNTLSLRTRFLAGESFNALLGRVKSADLAAYAHQDLPFEQLVEALNPERSLDHTPIFQVMFVMQNAPFALGELPGLRLEPIALEAAAPKFDLTLNLEELAGSLAGSFEYAANRFTADAINAMARKLQQLLQAIVANPDHEALTIDVLDDTERALVVDQWNRTAMTFPSGTLEGLFQAQALRTPGATAVIGLDGSPLSYAGLDAQSTRLAKQLSADGLEPGQIVGVRMARSTSTVISLLAILKAGGVYLPLDPAYPSERLDYMVTDAGASRVLDSLVFESLVLESLDGFDLDHASDLPLPGVSTDPDRLAYVIYTSGTTGLPKGVAVAHSAAINLMFARREAHDPLGAGDRVLAAISVGFDVSIGQLLLPLLSGATVVIAGDLKLMSAAGFWALVAGSHVTHINSVPSFLDSVLDAAPAAHTLALKRLMLGGEALSGALVERIRRVIPGLEVVNMYGPTEACIDATYYIPTAADLSAAVLPIGRPLPNYRAYVLDPRMQPAGIGVTGELYLGGDGLARGYINAPELTRERFVPDPFSPVLNDRLYRTGDRARWRADGAIEFLGRVDKQIKIRGFRVEPGEIEAQMRRHSGIRDAAVIADVHSGNTRLIAYYTGEAGVPPESLRAWLGATLPDYMVPAAFVKLEQLPLTANGKLDRKALVRPGEEAFVARAYTAPIGMEEETMAALWAELLKVDRVGRHDNFFELGGHSLLAVTLIERMRRQGLSCDVRVLFITPTVAGLVAASAAMPAEVTAPENGIAPGTQAITPEMLPLAVLTQTQIDRIAVGVPGGAANIQDIYPLAPLQEGILFQHLVSETGDPYLTPLLLGFAERGLLDGFLQALDRLVQRHDVLRTAMVTHDVEQPLQVVWRHAAVLVEEVELERESMEDAATQLLSRYDPRVFRLDVSQAPLLRVAVARDPAHSRWLLLLLTHHLILDHTSLEILVHEIDALLRDPDAILPPALPYRNFIAQTRLAPAGESHEAFFAGMLGDVDEPTAPYGVLRQEGATGTFEGRLTLDAALASGLRESARKLGVTPASLFHLAWAAVLGHLCDKTDVVFGTVLFGRMRSAAGADRVVGMFINTLPVRLHLDATGAAESVRATHRLLAELVAHEHAPLALAQRASAVPPPAPLFSSLFNYRHNAAQDASGTESGIEVIGATESTNYPLAMAVEDSPAGFALTAIAQSAPAGATLFAIDPTCVCRYLEQSLTELLRLLQQTPEQPISSLEILPAVERATILEQWNHTGLDVPHDALEALFSVQARKTPEAVAIVGIDGKMLTYWELEAKSTLLASRLVATDVAPGAVIGVRMERSADTIVALLAILKAGGVYLPLDPAYPSERLDYMAADAGASLVLDSLTSLTGPEKQRFPAELSGLCDPDRLAYIIYTSGTTGVPKGVAVPHRAAVNLAFARLAAHDPIGAGDRVLAAISVGFDVSIGQLLLPLLSGATVVIAGDLKAMAAAEFWTLVAQQGVTHINSVPSFVDSILDAAPAPTALRLKRLMLGGEALSGRLVARLHRRLPGLEVVNMYGPTEACIDATYHVATTADHALTTLPIGRPLPNYRAYVLDRHMRPAGVGVTGELYLAGAGLARGYVNAPVLTAERFPADPFSGVTNARLYRTGDRARFLTTGELEFLGRVDNQVKIRGFRVEPAEVEAQLRHQPGIHEAAVVAQVANGSARLLAYYTLADSAGQPMPTPESLRAALTAVLPDYMLPAAFVQLDELPLSLNGKLDRKALPTPDQPSLAVRQHTAPVGEIETRMASLWADVLKLDHVGRDDNFFAIGGDSLSAMRLVNILSRAFEIPVSVRSLLQHPTVEGLARELFSGDNRHRDRNLIPIQTTGTKPKIFFLHPASGHVFLYVPLARALGADQPVYGLQATGIEEGESPLISIEQMAAGHVEAILAEQPQGPYQLLGYSSGGLLAFAVAHQLKKRGAQVTFLALLDTSLPDPTNKRMANEETVLRVIAESLGIDDLVGNAELSVRELVERALAHGRLPVDFDPAYAERMAEIYRQTVRCYADYQLVPWDGPVLFLRALQRPEEAGPAPDWSPYVLRNLEVVELDCTHATLITPHMAQAVAELLNTRLAASSDRPLPVAYA